MFWTIVLAVAGLYVAGFVLEVYDVSTTPPAHRYSSVRSAGWIAAAPAVVPLFCLYFALLVIGEFTHWSADKWQKRRERNSRPFTQSTRRNGGSSSESSPHEPQ